jgi:hypothetical protein
MFCEVIQRIKHDSYKLRLSNNIKAIYLVFYTFLFWLDTDNLLLG